MKELKESLPDLIKISDERNRYIHDQFEFKEENVKKGKIKIIRLTRLDEFKMTPDEKEITIEELGLFLEEVGELQKKLNYFSEKIN